MSLLQENNIRISMTQSGSPYDNTMAERVNSILKTEPRLDQTFAGYRAAVAVVHVALDAYHRLRTHMSLGYLTPDEVTIQPKTPLKMEKQKAL